MDIAEISKKTQEDFTRLTRLPVNSVIGLSKIDKGWAILLECLERKAIPDTMDVLGEYEVWVDSDCNLLRFQRRRLRKRGETSLD